MATVKKQGRGYKITVSHGYDINGKQLRSYMTWVPGRLSYEVQHRGRVKEKRDNIAQIV